MKDPRVEEPKPTLLELKSSNPQQSTKISEKIRKEKKKKWQKKRKEKKDKDSTSATGVNAVETSSGKKKKSRDPARLPIIAARIKETMPTRTSKIWALVSSSDFSSITRD